MKLNTTNSENLLPARVLSNIPEIMDETNVKKVCGKDITIVDLGSLATHRKFMIKNSAKVKGRRLNSSMKEDSWSGTDTWEDYISLLENGDDNVMKKIKIQTGVKVKELAKKYEDVIRNYRFDVAGEFFDVGLVLTGVPESWLEPEAEPEEVVRVDILINGAFHAGIDENEIVNASARLLAIAKILEDNGVQVSLKMINANVGYDEDRKRSLITLITLKEHSEPINYRKLSAIMSPAHHRRGVFKVMEESEPKMSPSYGRPLALKNCISLHDKRAIDKLEKELFGGKK